MTLAGFVASDHAGGERCSLIEARREMLDRIGCEIFAETLRAGREVRLHVNGSSMLPSVWPHDALVVRPLIGAKPSIGQLLLFRRDGRLIAHRVVGSEWDDTGTARVVTRGDALPVCDEPVSESEILGVVNAIVRGGRELPARAQQPRGILAFTLRKSQLACRMALKVHALLLRFARQAEAGC